MLLKISLVLLVGWLLGVFGVYSAGQLHHILFLAGFMLALLSFARARDVAMQAIRRRDADIAATSDNAVGSKTKQRR